MDKKVKLDKEKIVANVAKELNIDSTVSQGKMEKILRDAMPDDVGSYEQAMMVVHNEMKDQLTPDEQSLEYMKAFLTIGELHAKIKYMEMLLSGIAALDRLKNQN